MEESEVVEAVSIKKTLEVIDYLNISNIQYNKFFYIRMTRFV